MWPYWMRRSTLWVEEMNSQNSTLWKGIEIKNNFMGKAVKELLTFGLGQADITLLTQLIAMPHTSTQWYQISYLT